jgi:hypothetical protein
VRLPDIFVSFQALRGIPDDVFPSIKMIERNTGGSGNSKTKLVSLRDAIQLVMVLPGKIAKETRAQFANIIERYLASDKTLVDEMQAHAESSAPVHVLARESVFGSGESLSKRQKLHDAEVARIELENQKLFVSVQREMYEAYAMACPDGKPDDRIRLLFKDNIFNRMQDSMRGSNGQPMLITNDEGNLNRPITISTVAAELGMRFTTEDLKRIGALVKKRYWRRHGEAPAKHEQMVGGSVRAVNSYTVRDKDLVEAVLREWQDRDDDSSSSRSRSRSRSRC